MAKKVPTRGYLNYIDKKTANRTIKLNDDLIIVNRDKKPLSVSVRNNRGKSFMYQGPVKCQKCGYYDIIEFYHINSKGNVVECKYNSFSIRKKKYKYCIGNTCYDCLMNYNNNLKD